jgi:hypothetical protein
VFQHLQARNDIEASGRLLGQFLDADVAVIDFQSRLEQVQARHGQWGFAHVYPGHAGAALGQRLAQNAAAATDVEHAFPGYGGACVDVVRAQGDSSGAGV